MRNRNFLLAAAAALSLCVAGAASATPIFETGNNPQPNESNVINNVCTGGIDGPALTIKGCFNQAHSTLVDFQSNENIQYAAGGQAKIIAADGAFSSLKISVEGQTFTDLILNIFAFNNGSVTFTANLHGGGVATGTFTLDGNGQNFFTILAGLGESFDSISFLTAGTGVELDTLDNTTDVKQVRISGTTAPSDVPEPGTLTILGMGLLGAGLIRRRRAA